MRRTADLGRWPSFLAFGFLALISVARSGGAEAWKDVQPVVAKYCFRCHGETKQQALIRFDRVAGFDGAQEQLWAKAHEALVKGDKARAEDVIRQDKALDALQQEIEDLIEEMNYNIREVIRILRG